MKPHTTLLVLSTTCTLCAIGAVSSGLFDCSCLSFVYREGTNDFAFFVHDLLLRPLHSTFFFFCSLHRSPSTFYLEEYTSTTTATTYYTPPISATFDAYATYFINISPSSCLSALVHGSSDLTSFLFRGNSCFRVIFLALSFLLFTCDFFGSGYLNMYTHSWKSKVLP